MTMNSITCVFSHTLILNLGHKEPSLIDNRVKIKSNGVTLIALSRLMRDSGV